MPAFVIGDVHGNVAALRTLIGEARRLVPDVDLYHVGDLVDRGPNARQVIDCCIAEKIQGVCGNHELWLRDVLTGGTFDPSVLSRAMMGGPTLQSYGISLTGRTPEHTTRAIRAALPADHVAYLLALPAYRWLTVGAQTYVILHAGLSTETAAGILHDTESVPNNADLLHHAFSGYRAHIVYWMRPRVERHGLHRFAGAVQIMGHVPVRQAIIAPGHFCAIDTGCSVWPDGRLTGILLYEDGRIQEVSVPGGFIT